ncbi:general secretion pathway protein [Bordetella genomosp. 7]|uniref:General secretion pathway protein n=1 Tax=Bordetella genomosp. 7 TaxID=1416805 RepID=A0A261RJ44_9BORD|nr:general secretion pathway protein [Bordetella genomosp. 7]OZI25056.1 general secretion pathway protein [Bordetella genomosp. 7]
MLDRLAVSFSVWARRIGACWDAGRFQARRADYYEYLADLIVSLDGRKTLRDVFADDARRYGSRTVRGRLALHWLHRYQESGGDLAATFSRSIPHDEAQLIGTAQRAGGDALPHALRGLADAVRLVQQARQVLAGATAAGVVALAVAVGVLTAVPFFTVPRLQQVFQAVPADYYGGLTRGLFGLARALQSWLPFWAVLLAGGAGLAVWAAPMAVGPWRVRLDRWFPWRLYRDAHAIRFLAMLAIMLRQRGNLDTRLREALAALARRARPWLAWHVNAMLSRVEHGIVGAGTFETGLFDRETAWFMGDVIAARGLEAGVEQARLRAESRALRRIRREAQALRWGLLLLSVAAVLALTLWHYAVIDELRRALTNFYASQ